MKKDKSAVSLGKKSWNKRKEYQGKEYFQELQKKSLAKRMENKKKLTNVL